MNENAFTFQSFFANNMFVTENQLCAKYAQLRLGLSPGLFHFESEKYRCFFEVNEKLKLSSFKTFKINL